MRAVRATVVLVTTVVLGWVSFSPVAQAATSISRADLNGTSVRIEGSGATPNAALTVNGGALSGTATSTGSFRIENSSFAAPADCVVTVSDGSTSASRTLTGCSISQPPPTSQPPPSSAPTLTALTASPTDVLGPDPSTGTVTLSAAAPADGFVVDLRSDNPDVATVPATVTVPGGSTRTSFTITTVEVTRAQSAIIIGTVGGDFTTERHAIVTVWDAFNFSNGSVSVIPGSNGSGRVTSQPAGVDCTITNGSGSGVCTKSFPVDTVVRLAATAAAGSKFIGFAPRAGCPDASKITVRRGTTIICQVGFQLK